VKNKFDDNEIGIFWSGGKDSTAMLHLIGETCGEIPWQVVYVNTGYHFRETHNFISKLSDTWQFDVCHILAESPRTPNNSTVKECCYSRKTYPIKATIEEFEFKGVFVAIRRDEHGVRNKERFISPRDQGLKWNIKEQDTELSGWNIYYADYGDQCHHFRIHPLLHWNEVDVWNYIRDFEIPVNQLYFSKNGKRYRSLGCKTCTVPIESNAVTIDDMIKEIKSDRWGERDGRWSKKDMTIIYEHMRALGYF